MKSDLASLQELLREKHDLKKEKEKREKQKNKFEQLLTLLYQIFAGFEPLPEFDTIEEFGDFFYRYSYEKSIDEITTLDKFQAFINEILKTTESNELFGDKYLRILKKISIGIVEIIKAYHEVKGERNDILCFKKYVQIIQEFKNFTHNLIAVLSQIRQGINDNLNSEGHTPQQLLMPVVAENLCATMPIIKYKKSHKTPEEIKRMHTFSEEALATNQLIIEKLEREKDVIDGLAENNIFLSFAKDWLGREERSNAKQVSKNWENLFNHSFLKKADFQEEFDITDDLWGILNLETEKIGTYRLLLNNFHEKYSNSDKTPHKFLWRFFSTLDVKTAKLILLAYDFDNVIYLNRICNRNNLYKAFIISLFLGCVNIPQAFIREHGLSIHILKAVALSGNLEVMQFLFSNPEVLQSYQQAADELLLCAVQAENPALFNYLLDMLAKSTQSNITISDDVFLWALYTLNKTAINSCLKFPLVKKNVKNEIGLKNLHEREALLEFFKSADIELIKTVLTFLKSQSSSIKVEHSMLRIAAEIGRLEIVKCLIYEYGIIPVNDFAMVNVITAGAKHIDVVKFLIENNSTFGIPIRRYCLDEAVNNEDLITFSYLWPLLPKKGSYYFLTLLIIAIDNGRIAAVKKILQLMTVDESTAFIQQYGNTDYKFLKSLKRHLLNLFLPDDCVITNGKLQLVCNNPDLLYILDTLYPQGMVIDFDIAEAALASANVAWLKYAFTLEPKAAEQCLIRAIDMIESEPLKLEILELLLSFISNPQKNIEKLFYNILNVDKGYATEILLYLLEHDQFNLRKNLHDNRTLKRITTLNVKLAKQCLNPMEHNHYLVALNLAISLGELIEVEDLLTLAKHHYYKKMENLIDEKIIPFKEMQDLLECIRLMKEGIKKNMAFDQYFINAYRKHPAGALRLLEKILNQKFISLADSPVNLVNLVLPIAHIIKLAPAQAQYNLAQCLIKIYEQDQYPLDTTVNSQIMELITDCLENARTGFKQAGLVKDAAKAEALLDNFMQSFPQNDHSFR